MSDIFSKIAIAKIEEAIQNGEFDNLSGQGKPINLDYLNYIQPELRASYTILKNSGAMPEEVTLLKEIAELKEVLASCTNKEEKETLRQKISYLTLKYDLIIETMRKRR
jgi:hypothetical protein